VPTIPIISQTDSFRTTVADLVKNPRLIPRRMLSLTENEFMADWVLRDGGSAPGGVVQYQESSPLFADSEPVIKAEFGEYQYVYSSEGFSKVAVAVNRGLAIRISEDMRRRNQMERVNTQMTQAKNTLVRAWEMAFRDAIVNNASVPYFNASGTTEGWEASDATIAKDILLAKQVVGESQSPSQTGNFYGFVADTLICSIGTANVIIGNDKYREFYRGNLADQNILYKGKLPNQIEGLNVMTSRFWPDNLVVVCEAKTVGFKADERPTQWTPLAEDVDREVWRSNGSRISAVAIDQPRAACFIKATQGADNAFEGPTVTIP